MKNVKNLRKNENEGEKSINLLAFRDRLFDNFMRDPFLAGSVLNGTQIRTDIRESDKEYVFIAELPGVKKEDIFLELKDDVLTFGLEQKQELEEDRDGYLCRERR